MTDTVANAIAEKEWSEAKEQVGNRTCLVRKKGRGGFLNRWRNEKKSRKSARRGIRVERKGWVFSGNEKGRVRSRAVRG